MRNIKLFEEFSDIQKCKIYAGLGGGFGGSHYTKIQRIWLHWDGEGKEKDEYHNTYHLLADGHIELKELINRIRNFSNSKQTLISLGILRAI